MKVLKARYIESIPNKIQEIDVLFELHAKMSCKTNILEVSKLQVFLHNLSGSGGIYGLNEITVAARASLNVFEQSEGNVFLLKDKLSALKDTLALIQRKYSVNTK